MHFCYRRTIRLKQCLLIKKQAFLSAMLWKNLLMLLPVLISSCGCTWEVWRALKKIELLGAQLLRIFSAFQTSRVHLLWLDFILGLNFISLLFLGMVIYDNEFKTKENKI